MEKEKYHLWDVSSKEKQEELEKLRTEGDWQTAARIDYDYLLDLQDEEERLRKKVETGAAENYQEAEQMIMKEDIGKYIDGARSYREVIARYFYDSSPGVSDQYDKNKENWREPEYYEEWRRSEHADNQINNEIQHDLCLPDCHLKGLTRKFERALYHLPFAEALDKAEGFLLQADEIRKDNREKTEGEFDIIMSDKNVAELIFSKIIPENIDLFLESSLEKYIAPDAILKTMCEQNASVEIRKKILRRYSDRIDIARFPTIGEESIFRGFENQEQLEREALEKKVAKKQKEKEESIQKKEEDLNFYLNKIDENIKNYGYVNLGRTRDLLATFSGLIRISGKVPDNYKKVLEKIKLGIDCRDSFYSQSVYSGLERDLANLEVEVEVMLGKEPEDIRGEGLEFGTSEFGGRKIYLDGKMIPGLVGDIEFGDKAFNEEMVTWVMREIIDRNRISGLNHRDTVYVWKKGWDRPKEITRDNAWEIDDSTFRIFAPEIAADGKIKAIFFKNGVKSEVEFE